MPKSQRSKADKRKDRVEELTQAFLDQYDFQGPNFDGTPERVARMWETFLNVETPTLTTFPVEGTPGLILIKDHISWGFCPHHLLPVKYTFRIGYIPHHQVLGLSKLARIADFVCAQLLIQEDMPSVIGEMIKMAIDPLAVGVIINGEHQCMQMRGVKSTCVSASSSYLSGAFLREDSARMEFMTL